MCREEMGRGVKCGGGFGGCAWNTKNMRGK